MRNNRKTLKRVAERHGVRVLHISNWHQLADRLAEFWGIERVSANKSRRFCFDGMEARGWIPPRPDKREPRKADPIKDALWDKSSRNHLRKQDAQPEQRDLASREDCMAFYKTTEWRGVRDKVLAVFGRTCLACGKSEADGVIINVDHIRPLKRYWHMRLDVENLQPICAACNRAKGSRSEIDLRPTTYERALSKMAKQ